MHGACFFGWKQLLAALIAGDCAALEQACGLHALKQAAERCTAQLEALLHVALRQATALVAQQIVQDHALCAGQLHRVGQYLVTGLLPVKFPCVVLSGVFQENITFPETVRPGGPGQTFYDTADGLLHLLHGCSASVSAFGIYKSYYTAGSRLRQPWNDRINKKSIDNLVISPYN